jgi:hypothetical protein
MSLPLDAGQLGWALAGFFAFMFFIVAAVTWGQSKRAQAIGEDKGWHDRQHWEDDQVVSGKLRRK